MAMMFADRPRGAATVLVFYRFWKMLSKTSILLAKYIRLELESAEKKVEKKRHFAR